MENDLIQAKNALQHANRILLVSHRKPDGDTLGATCGLACALKKTGKRVDLACVDEISERFSFLACAKNYLREFRYDDYDLIVICDAGAKHMTSFERKYEEFLSNRVPILNIDHHISNENFGTYNIVDPGSASATMLVYHLLKYCGYSFDRDIATALITGIYNDTGGFMHANTSAEALHIAGDLMRSGVLLQEIIRKMFKTTPIAQLRLWGRALEKLRMNRENVLVSVLEPADFRETEASFDATSGIVDAITAVPASRYTVLLADSGEGNIKGSFRTRRDDVDVAALAEKFGGGGHKKAAGFSIPGSIVKETVWKIVQSGKDGKDAHDVLQFAS